MATVIQRLSALGLPTDYSSRKRLYEESGLGGQHGNFQGTAQQNLAFASWAEGQKKPSPEGSAPSSTAGQTDWQIDTSGFNSLQRSYLDAASKVPNQGELYDKYSGELGLPQQQEIVTGLTKSILDLEKKIKDVEPQVASRTKDFLVTEAQRQKIQTTEEKPLRDQYLESLRRKEYEGADLSNKQQLLATRMKYAADEAQRPLDLLGQMIAWQADADKAASSGVNIDLSGLMPELTGQPGGAEAKPATNPNQMYDTLMDEVLGKTGTLLDQSTSAKPKTTKKTSKEVQYAA